MRFRPRESVKLTIRPTELQPDISRQTRRGDNGMPVTLRLVSQRNRFITEDKRSDFQRDAIAFFLQHDAILAESDFTPRALYTFYYDHSAEERLFFLYNFR